MTLFICLKKIIHSSNPCRTMHKRTPNCHYLSADIRKNPLCKAYNFLSCTSDLDARRTCVDNWLVVITSEIQRKMEGKQHIKYLSCSCHTALTLISYFSAEKRCWAKIPQENICVPIYLYIVKKGS